MKTLLRVGTCVIGMSLTVVTGWAEEFSQSLTADEFAAAGLDQLSPEQLAQLDALVKAKQSGQLAAVRADEAAKVRAEVAKENKPGLLGRMRVMLTPGTEIEYEELETSLVGAFRGYEKGKVLRLANGQRWQVVEGSFWAPKKDENKPRKVVIKPGSLGSFFLEIEDGGRPKVKFVGAD